MKNLSRRRQEVETTSISVSALIDRLMSTQSSHGDSFECANLKGRNVGAAMIMRRGTSNEPHDCCGINFYINNNIQGVNNSLLIGSEVNMGDPGVCLALGDVKFGNGFLETNKKKRSNSNLGFCLMLVFVFIVLFLLLSLF